MKACRFRGCRCTPPQGPCSWSAPRRTCRTCCRCRRGHPPAPGRRGSAARSRGPGHPGTGPPSQASCHPVVPVPCPGDPLCDVRRVGCDLCGHDPLLHILQVGEHRVLGGRHEAEEGRPAHRCRDVVVSRPSFFATFFISSVTMPRLAASICAASVCSISLLSSWLGAAQEWPKKTQGAYSLWFSLIRSRAAAAAQLVFPAPSGWYTGGTGNAGRVSPVPGFRRLAGGSPRLVSGRRWCPRSAARGPQLFASRPRRYPIAWVLDRTITRMAARIVPPAVLTRNGST